MKYLNLGCGNHFSREKEWVNLDFFSSDKTVISHNLLDGIPFENNTFDVVYHSHVLEHFSKEDGENLIMECFRVLKPNGVLRIAVPDLEMITKNYLTFLEKGIKNNQDEMIRANYDWMLIEMYDQTVRNVKGGRMKKYLHQSNIENEEFIFERIGEEGRGIRNDFINSTINKPIEKRTKNLFNKIKKEIKNRIRNQMIKVLKINTEHLKLGAFRLSGEIHQWMYDRYSLSHLLQSKGGTQLEIRNAFTSYIYNWSAYNLDGKNEMVRKPDSLFIECIKK